MIFAHLVPGYIAAAQSEPHWPSTWRKGQRAVLWATAICSTFLPDVDQVYDVLIPRQAGFATFWSHSVFVWLGVALCWWLLHRTGRWPYLQTLVGLMAIGGLSHVVLDVVVHGKAVLYPILSAVVGIPGLILTGGTEAYVASPIFLTEPILVSLVAAHWIMYQKLASLAVKVALLGLAVGVIMLLTVLLRLTLGLQYY